MNNLPKHRSVMSGRTHSSSYNPSDFDPIERPLRNSGDHAVDWILLAMFVLLVLSIARQWL